MADFETCVKNGEKCYEKNDYGNAILYFEKAIELTNSLSKEIKEYLIKKIAYLKKMCAKAYYKNGNNDNAIKYFTEAISLAPKNKELYERRGKAYERRGKIGDRDKANEDYEKVRQLKQVAEEERNRKECDEARRRAARERESKEHDEARKREIDNYTAATYVKHGEMCYEEKDYDKAIENFVEAIRIYIKTGNGEKLAEAYEKRGDSYLAKGDYDKAIEDYKNTSNEEKLAEAYEKRGDSYLAKCDYEKAMDDYITVLQKKLKNNESLENKLKELEKKIPDIFIDYRDYKKYKTVKIGEKTWMAENLAYNIGNEKCYDNEEYGMLYDLETAKKACPKGWRLPRKTDWKELMNKNEKFWMKDGSFLTLKGGYCSNKNVQCKGKAAFWIDEDGLCWSVFNNGTLEPNRENGFKGCLLSVRCVKDEQNE